MQAARDKAAKPSIVITELPYQTNKSDFVATVARLVEEQKLTGALLSLVLQCGMLTQKDTECCKLTLLKHAIVFTAMTLLKYACEHLQGFMMIF